MFKKLILTTIVAITLSGCERTYTGGEIKAAQKIIENREKYSKEIIEATNQCIKNANTLTNLSAAGNDSEETIRECSIQAQTAYGAYSPWYESYLLIRANSKVGDVKE